MNTRKNLNGRRNLLILLLAFLASAVVVSAPASAQQQMQRDGDLGSRTFAAAQTAKQQCIKTCRARYRDCRRLNQLPSSQCRGVYQDCARYTCSGLGPG